MKRIRNSSAIVWYFAILPFLFPTGYANYYPVYKKMVVGMLGIALVIILAREIYLIIANQGKIKVHFALIALIVSEVILLVVTLSVQGTVTQGLQKIIVIPVLCFFLDETCRKDLGYVINVICNILISDFVLNLFFFNQWLVPKYFLIENHIMFIGHVQVAAEIAILGIFVAYIEYSYGVHKRKSIVLFILAMLTMLYANTIASFMSIGLLAILSLLGRNRGFKKHINKHIYFYSCMQIAISYVLINIQEIHLFSKYRAVINTFFNGRPFIWSEGWELFEKRKFFGYGAYGVLIKPFWSAWSSNKLGFNYAHNTLLQLMLDGGIVLAIAFIITIALYIRELKKTDMCSNTKYVAYVLLLIFLSIGLFESLTEYFYFFIFLSILPFLGEIDENKSLA